MFILKNIFKFRIFNSNKRFFCSKESFSSISQVAKYLSPLLGMNESTIYKHLVKNDIPVNLEPMDIKRKIWYFRYLNASNEDILDHLGLLKQHLSTLENRATILRECGFVEALNLLTVSKYLTIVRRRIKDLKLQRWLSQDLNMYDQLKTQFDFDIRPNVKNCDDLCLQFIREAFLNEYLRRHMKLTENEVKKLWKCYSKIKHRSFGHTQRILDVLQHEYNFKRDKIIANLYLLYADPENLLRYLEIIPSIAGLDIRDVIIKRPKLAMIQCENVRTVLELLRQHQINETEILNYSMILTFSPDTVKTRLGLLSEVKEFNVLSSHPRFLKLITYQPKAVIRLDFLRQLNVRCASLSVLSGSSQNFEKYVRDGCDKLNSKDVCHYLNKIFDRQDNEAIKELKRHPNWYHVPTVQMEDTFEFLKSEGFTSVNIFENIQILLYPKLQIERRLQKLYDCKMQKEPHEDFGLELSNVAPEKILSLCLYLIELDFHFTGDGIWPEEIQQSDATTNHFLPMPESLSKQYKFGMKPARSGSS
ncbi:transcription termination factor 5, mitochondrial [Malaya genurostris]|uniref:transcription termination factor 5, mitochondrial n=1 Tax=Malaya genurostris TaxID=325434 RepID=UPI0026F40946|nr:transcription termination factor 5, mitochondrial [Malaya genurostris]